MSCLPFEAGALGRGARARELTRAGLLVAVVVGGALVGCARGPQARASGLRSVLTRDVTLQTDLPPERATELAERLQRTRDVFAHDIFPCARTAALPTIRVTALTSRADMNLLTGDAGVGGYHAWAPVSWLENEIVVHTGAPDALARDASLYETISHELAHLFLGICYPRLPTWLNEGLASVYESVGPVVQGRVALGRPTYAFGSRLGYARRGDRLLTVVRRDLLPGVEELRRLGPETFRATQYSGLQGYRMRVENYAGAWLVAHMMLVGEQTLHDPFQRYLRDLRSAPEREQVLWTRAFEGIDLEAMRRAYADRRAIPFGFVGVSPQAAIEARTTALSERDGHLLWARSLLVRGRFEPALAHLDAADALGGPSAGSALLRGTQAFMTRRVRDAEVEFARAAQQDPELTSAAHARVIAASERTGSAFERHVAQLLALAARGDDLAVVALAYLELGQLDEALELATRAVERDAQCWRCQVALARARLEMGDAAAAVDPMERGLALSAHLSDPLREQLVGWLATARQASASPSTRDRAGIRAVISAHLAEVRACYESELDARPDLEGRVMVSFVLAADGTVQSARVRESTLGHPPTESCVLAKLRTWRFPPAADATGVNYPFVFTVAE